MRVRSCVRVCACVFFKRACVIYISSAYVYLVVCVCVCVCVEDIDRHATSPTCVLRSPEVEGYIYTHTHIQMLGEDGKSWLAKHFEIIGFFF